MDINSLLESIFTFAIGIVSISTLILKVSKRIIDELLQAILKKYDYELKRKLEEYKLEQQKIHEENKIRFTKLHEERAEVIKNLYSKIVDLEYYLNFYVSDYNTGKESTLEFIENRENLLMSATDFSQYANKNKIFFDEKIVNCIKEINAIVEIILGMYETDCKDNSDSKCKSTWNELATRIVNEDIPEFRCKLESEFRKILGV